MPHLRVVEFQLPLDAAGRFRTAEGLVGIQALAAKDIQHLNGLQLQGVTRKGYCYGAINAIVRASGKGGDLITCPDGTVWLVRNVFESWPGWTAVGLTQQVNP